MNTFAVEGFDNLADYTRLTRIFSDLQQQAFLSDRASSSDTIANNIQKTKDAVLNEKKNMVRQLSGEIAAADTNLVNTAYYLSRSKDLVNLATDVTKVASDQINVSSINKNLTSRQNEINEWSNYNKLEILYFMQIIFISLSLIGILAYLLSISYISSSLFWTVVSVIFVIDLLIIVLKSRFTTMNRDGRYWHKMRFANQPYTKSDSDSSKCS
jgi:hypothetical protein